MGIKNNILCSCLLTSNTYNVHRVNDSWALVQILLFFLMTMATGTVKFFNTTKGFGFITPDDGSKEVFVHISALNGVTIKENDKVQYDVEDTEKGKNAINVELI